MRILRRGGVLVLCLAAMLGCAAFANAADPEVERGIRQVESGDYDAAIAILDTAVRKLSADPDAGEELGRAYLFLGIAFVGKGHEAAAKARFRLAVRRVKDLTLSTDEFAPKVIGLFEAAREEELKAQSRAAKAAPGKKEVAAVRDTTPEKKGSGAKWLLIGGGLAAAGGGIAVAAGGGSSSGSDPTPPPAPEPTVTARTSLEGQAIMNVTVVEFTADARNLTSPTYDWEFGDNATGSGQTVTHVYGRDEHFAATVRATGAEGTKAARVELDVGGVSGVWIQQPPGPETQVRLDVGQHDANLVGTWRVQHLDDQRWDQFELSGVLESPNRFRVDQHGGCGTYFEGTYSEDLSQMVGYYGFADPGCGEPGSMTLVRR